MTNEEKRLQLRKYKYFATGLFLLMTALFISMTLLQHRQPAPWMGYVKAFAEAAMVGALADWFAVTALFHYPMGLRIPHTNLIENSKQRIGDNLGHFVVDNFLTAENIRPYISRMDLTRILADWLQQPKNKVLLQQEVNSWLHRIVLQLDDHYISSLIARKGRELIHTLNVNALLANGIQYLVQQGAEEKVLSFIAAKLKTYIADNEDLVRERVKQESSMLIPGFVDNIIARKITAGLARYLEEIETNQQHPVRRDIRQQLLRLSEDIRNKTEWYDELRLLKEDLLSSAKTEAMAADIWDHIKTALLDALQDPASGLQRYLNRSIEELSVTFRTDEALIDRMNKWIRYHAYKTILRHRNKAGDLISTTVGNWQGRDLSKKLELEVGKDLQFIRVNGTLVGGLVGLLLYALAHWLL